MNADTATAKPGTGENRMTPTGFKVPFVEKVTVPSSAGYEWKVKADVLDVKKINMQEKVKLAKPGLSIIDELEKLAAEAKEKGGAQVRQRAETLPPHTSSMRTLQLPAHPPHSSSPCSPC
jgi:hypothetical protein